MILASISASAEEIHLRGDRFFFLVTSRIGPILGRTGEVAIEVEVLIPGLAMTTRVSETFNFMLIEQSILSVIILHAFARLFGTWSIN